MNPSPPVLAAVVFDCADALVTATFWSAALDRPLPEDASSDFVQLPGVPALSFYAVPEPKSAKNRVHVDLHTRDLDAEVARLLALGATRVADLDEYGFRWTTLAYPEGNAFDVVADAGAADTS